MLPSWLSGSYRQYKRDTDSIASWLAQTAIKHGYADGDILSGGAGKQAKVRSKTKSAKKSGHAKTKKSESVCKYIISSQDFVMSSDYVASSARESVKIPDDSISTIRRVIKARKLSNAFFQQQEDANPSDEADTSTSSPSLSPSCKCWSLCDHASTQAQAGQEEPPQKTVENIFSSLNIEEPSEEFIQASATDHKMSKSRVEHEAEALDEARMLSFAVYCLFSDLNGIRVFLQKV
jgi:hypothetical protein